MNEFEELLQNMLGGNGMGGMPNLPQPPGFGGGMGETHDCANCPMRDTCCLPPADEWRKAHGIVSVKQPPTMLPLKEHMSALELALQPALVAGEIAHAANRGADPKVNLMLLAEDVRGMLRARDDALRRQIQRWEEFEIDQAVLNHIGQENKVSRLIADGAHNNF